MMRKFFWFLFLVFTGFYANGQTISSDTILINEVVVTTQCIPQEQFLIPYSISLLDKKEMDHFTKRSTPEMLLNTDGVFIQKTNHGGG